MGDSSFGPQICVTLADGNEYGLTYPIGSLIFLNREYKIDLLEAMSGSPVPDDETEGQRAAREAANRARVQFVVGNIDRLVMAGTLVKGRPSIVESMVSNLPVIALMALVNAVFAAILRDLSSKAPAEGTKNPPPAA